MSTLPAQNIAGLALRILLAAGGFAVILSMAVRFGDQFAAPLAGTWPATQRIPGSLAISVLSLGLLCVLWRSLGPREGDVLGLGRLRQAWKPALTGCLLWAVPAAVGLATTQALGLTELGIGAGAGSVLTLVVIHLLAVGLAEALPEELVFRGYVHGLLARRLRLLWTLLLQSLLFTGVACLVRGGAVGFADLVMFVAMAAAFGYLRERSGTVWLGVGIHLAFQTASQMLIGGWKGPLALEGDPIVAMLVLGAIPFTVAVNVGDYLIRTRPGLVGVYRPAGNSAGDSHPVPLRSAAEQER